jgi:hypothetical protein
MAARSYPQVVFQRDRDLEDAAYNQAVHQHVKIVLVRRALED